jgi:hypothetical protein
MKEWVSRRKKYQQQTDEALAEAFGERNQAGLDKMFGNFKEQHGKELTKVFGNIDGDKNRSIPEVTELLEAYLTSAKGHPFGSIAIVMVGYSNDKHIVACDFAGEVKLEPSLKEGFRILTEKIEASIEGWTLPEQDKTLDESYVCYNVANGPLGFDFVVWLATVEMNRVRAGAPAPLKVGFYQGKDSAGRMHLDNRNKWLERVFRPALPLLGAIESPAACHGFRPEIFTEKEIIANYRKGEKVPFFKSKLASPHPGAITITFREAKHWPQRNSNHDAWHRFANDLRSVGESVVIVRDTAKADEPFHDFTICPEASKDLQVRCALYQEAKANLFVANGPAILAIHGEKPLLMFVPIESEDSDYLPNTPSFWKKNYDMVAGVDQYPWSTPQQKIVWDIDSYENIVAAYKSLNL